MKDYTLRMSASSVNDILRFKIIFFFKIRTTKVITFVVPDKYYRKERVHTTLQLLLTHILRKMKNVHYVHRQLKSSESY